MCKGEKPTRKVCVSSVPVLGRKSLPCSLSQRALTVPLCVQHCALRLPRTRGEETVPTLVKFAHLAGDINGQTQEH